MVVLDICLTLNKFIISYVANEPPTLKKLSKELTTWVGELQYKTCELKKQTTGK
jgi:hypothetical protein